jgi:hypothetical protein
VLCGFSALFLQHFASFLKMGEKFPQHFQQDGLKYFIFQTEVLTR